MRAKGGEILRFIITAVGLAGLLAVAVTAPGLFSALGPFNKRNLSKYRIKRSFDYGQSRGLIKVDFRNGKHNITLTEKGRKKLSEFRVGELKLPKPRRWDKKWRLVLFDIPEKYKLNRNAFSAKLKELGMVMIQKSAWVWPYPLENELELMKLAYEIRPFVRLAVVEKIDRSIALKKHFNLK